MTSKVLTIGEAFTASQIEGDKKFFLRDVLEDRFDNLWAIAVDEDNVPYIMQESDIDDEKQVILVFLPKVRPPQVDKPKKKGK
jgi:hypothetical protein